MPDAIMQALRDALSEELIYLWGDLAEDYGMSLATPPETSVGCENRIERIHQITKLVGPVGAGNVQLPFLLTSMYERVHAQIGVTVTVPEGIMQRAREYVANGKLEAAR